MPGWLVAVLVVAVGLAVIAGLLVLASFFVVRRSSRDPFVAGADHVSLANCLGTEGLELSLSGTGTLALFADELRFVIATPRRQLAIPRRRLGVTLEQYPSPGDYRPGDKPALVLRWRDRGVTKVVGFRVQDPDEWRTLILR
jgi:hypothetical protein